MRSVKRVGWNPTEAGERTRMRSTQQFSITLPNDMADMVRGKVASGEYATESEVIRDGLRAMQARDRAVEVWLREQVGPAYDAIKADPSRAVSAQQVRATLAAEHARVTHAHETDGPAKPCRIVGTVGPMKAKPGGWRKDRSEAERPSTTRRIPLPEPVSRIYQAVAESRSPLPWPKVHPGRPFDRFDRGSHRRGGTWPDVIQDVSSWP